MGRFFYLEVYMNEQIVKLQAQFEAELAAAQDAAELENIRVAYLGKKGSITDLLKGMKDLSVEEKKDFGQKVNILKNEATEKITAKMVELKEKEIEREINSMPEFDLSMPADLSRGSYHPITLVQRECERIFKSMGFDVEDYSEVVTDYECFEALNIPKHHPARDMQDTYYLENGQLLKSHTSAAQNAIYKKYKDALFSEGRPIKAIFPGRCFRNEATDACHENTFFQMEGVMVDKDISISNLIFFMKTMLSEVFKRDVKVRLRPGFFPFVEPGFELDISCAICGGEGCPSCKHSGWLELCPCGMIHPEVLKAGGIDPEEYTGFAFGLGLTRLAMMKYGVKDIRDLNGGSLKALSQFTDDE
jgi:phenylalanyl-tRNA synthetase alpha chain